MAKKNLGLLIVSLLLLFWIGSAYAATQTVVIAEKHIAFTDGSGATLATGDLVYISAGNTVNLADADDSSKVAIGVCISTDGSAAQVQFSGKATVNVTDSPFAGDILYLSQTVGEATSTCPTAPAERQVIGVAISDVGIGTVEALLIIDFAAKWQ